MPTNEELLKFKSILESQKEEVENRFEQNEHFDLNSSFWKESMESC